MSAESKFAAHHFVSFQVLPSPELPVCAAGFSREHQCTTNLAPTRLANSFSGFTKEMEKRTWAKGRLNYDCEGALTVEPPAVGTGGDFE